MVKETKPVSRPCFNTILSRVFSMHETPRFDMHYHKPGHVAQACVLSILEEGAGGAGFEIMLGYTENSRPPGLCKAPLHTSKFLNYILLYHKCLIYQCGYCNFRPQCEEKVLSK